MEPDPLSGKLDTQQSGRQRVREKAKHTHTCTCTHITCRSRSLHCPVIQSTACTDIQYTTRRFNAKNAATTRTSAGATTRTALTNGQRVGKRNFSISLLSCSPRDQLSASLFEIGGHYVSRTCVPLSRRQIILIANVLWYAE